MKAEQIVRLIRSLRKLKKEKALEVLFHALVTTQTPKPFGCCPSG